MAESGESLSEALKSRGYTHRPIPPKLKHCAQSRLCSSAPITHMRFCACRCKECSVPAPNTSGRHQIFDSRDRLISTLSAHEAWAFVRGIDAGAIQRGG